MPTKVEVLYQLALGLEHIHKSGLIHRDIKHENVLIWVNPENGQVLMKWSSRKKSLKVNYVRKRERETASLTSRNFLELFSYLESI